LAERLAEEDKRLSVVHLTDLPKGWLGKVHAMHRGVQAATGEWLLFCDADVHLSPGALGKAIAWCESKKIDFLCALPTIVPATPFVDAAVALVMRLMVGSARAWSVDDPRSSAVFGFGAFMLARRAAFARTEGFEWLKLEVADDMGLALLMKRSGARCSLVNAVGEIGIQAYPSVGAMVRALEKNNFAIVGRCSVLRTLAFAAVVPLFELAPLAGFIPLGAQWLSWLGAAGVALALAATWISARWFGARAWAGLLFPVGVAILGAATVRAALVGFRQGGIRWRGTFYSAAELRSGIRVRYPE
jgi:hypothetical protein